MRPRRALLRFSCLACQIATLISGRCEPDRLARPRAGFHSRAGTGEEEEDFP
jgi:hypothetical protein